MGMMMHPARIAARRTTTTSRRYRHVALAILAATLLTALFASAFAQRVRRGNRANAEPEALHGSKASVEKMYDFARRYRYPFYLTPTNVDQAVAQGRLVALPGDSTYELTRGVGFSYATREAKQFVVQFAPQYLAACGTPLTVTSAARPTSRQPHNANPLSVHPTGIAVDLRRPPAGPCLTWVRAALAQLEERGFIEATEEHHPVHLHVAVLTAPGRVATLPMLVTATPTSHAPSAASVPLVAASQAVVSTAPVPRALRVSNLPASPAPHSASSAPIAGSGDAIRGRTYRVREGDTMWDLARRTGVSVYALARANHRSARTVLRPGVTLRIPEDASR